MSLTLEYRRLRAPQDDGELFVTPALDQCDALLQENLRRTEAFDYDLHGQSWSALRIAARQILIQQATSYTRSYQDVGQYSDQGPIILLGHQPELFHPGVWAKNFALDRLARNHGGVAVQLVIDHDLSRTNSLRVPSGSISAPHVELVPFDQGHEAVAHEERMIRDIDCFRGFGDRAAQAVGPLVPRPVVSKLWPWAVEAAERGANLGACLAQARHRLESDWGLNALEVPLSHICDSMPFRWFAAYILAELERVREAYNESLGEYRRVHRLRSAAQPVPDLTTDDDWLEAPFWVWTADTPARRGLLVRRSRNQLELSDGAGSRWTLSLSSGDLASCVEQLELFARQGLRLRPRALLTTIFARLFLGDVFLHGIGGAKYDQVSDQIVRRLFQMEPPGFVTLSATLLLPLGVPVIHSSEIVDLRRTLRDLRYHPEIHLGNGDVERSQVSRWVEEKRHWIAQELAKGKRRERHRAITRANEALQPFVEEKRNQVKKLCAKKIANLSNVSILRSREWSFCLFPEGNLQERLLELFEPKTYS